MNDGTRNGRDVARDNDGHAKEVTAPSSQREKGTRASAEWEVGLREWQIRLVNKWHSARTKCLRTAGGAKTSSKGAVE